MQNRKAVFGEVSWKNGKVLGVFVPDVDLHYYLLSL